ncbi:MAG: PEPxxWA-CTERM sorting domain-containing protein [Alphaproteobacteria bacterium]|nr:PEPxxWA-CTERM sorting domain-containing protein [Alphaproteobacteria bacterium]
MNCRNGKRALAFGAAFTFIAAMAGADPAEAATQRYFVVDGTGSTQIQPLTGVETLVQLYGYNTGVQASANTPYDIEETNQNTQTFFLFRSTTTGDLGLFSLAGATVNGGYAQSSGSLTGLPLSTTLAVKDDPGGTLDSYVLSGSTFTYSNRSAPNKTDGFALGGLAGQLFSITSSIGPGLNIDSIRIATRQGGGVGYFTLSNVLPGGSFEIVASLVPEPATWGLMIASFALIGGTVKRRARAVSGAA